MGYGEKLRNCFVVTCLAFPTLSCSGRQQENLPIAEVKEQTFDLPIGLENAFPDKISININEVPQVYFLKQRSRRTECPDGQPLSVKVGIKNGIGFYSWSVPVAPLGCTLVIKGKLSATINRIPIPPREF